VPEPLRILHLIDKNRLTTGSVVQMLEAARGQTRRGHEVWVGGRTGGDLEAACSAARFSFLNIPFRSVVDPFSVSTLRRHLRRHGTGIIHVHKGRAHALGLVAATGLGRHPRLVVNRGVTFPLDVFNRWKYRHPRVGAIVCVADAVREIVIRSGGLESERVHTIYGGTDCGSFDPGRDDGESVRVELGFGPEDLVIGQVSVRDWKGWSDLITAFASIAPRIPAARLFLVGCEPGSERLKVEEAALGAGLADRVAPLPFRSDMPNVLAACDVVVDASRAGTGITGTIREAMAMGRAVVATDCGGNRELVIDCEVGLMVPSRDPVALASALTRLLDDSDLRERLGAAARRRVAEHFSTEKRIDKLETLYRQVLG